MTERTSARPSSEMPGKSTVEGSKSQNDQGTSVPPGIANYIALLHPYHLRDSIGELIGEPRRRHKG